MGIMKELIVGTVAVVAASTMIWPLAALAIGGNEDDK
tara:strand:+ start:15830 stop:15940 length:111 start_codon:yes stop_codon:yes gene_type:complete